MKRISDLLFTKKLIFYLVFFGLGIYAGISVIRFKPELFYLNQIPKDQIEATVLSGQVGKLMSLPSGEQPIIETVTDLAPLKDKPFFAKAEVGDKVLIYQKAEVAILYRPSKNIIMNVVSPNYEDAIFSVASPLPTAAPTAIPTSVPTPVPTASPSTEPSLSPSPTATPEVSPKAVTR